MLFEAKIGKFSVRLLIRVRSGDRFAGRFERQLMGSLVKGLIRWATTHRVSAMARDPIGHERLTNPFHRKVRPGTLKAVNREP